MSGSAAAVLGDIITYLGADWKAVGDTIKATLSTDIQLLSKVNDGILGHGGKMLRPMTCLLAARACGGANHDSILCASASELLHNATLLHDDVADESDVRRGKPTVRSILGPSAAVLVGDFWLARAMETVLKCERYHKEAPIFSKTMTDLSEGEMFQLEKAAGGDTTEADYLRIIYCKTASLFEASCVSGAISADAGESSVNAMRDYAVALGTAFQIKDDILDYAGAAELGKPVGIDLKEQKITLPLLEAIKGSGREGDIRQMIRNVGRNPLNRFRLRRFVRLRKGVEAAAARLDAYVEKAVEALAPLPDTPAKEYLCKIARFNAFRTE